ncbi:hypothetical protein [Stenomitos frigidus]|uniref:DUF4145 domain-containing protein n=1 Tax=Stenomitos frigidus ULC18 TaxID=2107698 RepID=A0A2T1DT32_9CYAN|nr:hypothetical protein [Stenomitos frigidus]PSB23635.1 hypothetical protein C7B82_30655 [Stenomitos frigidus ULC18]
MIKLVSELIGALANLLWPIVVLIIALKFRPEIRILLTRLKKGKLLGQEVELESNVEQLRETVEKAERESLQSSSATYLSESDPNKNRLESIDVVASNPLDGTQDAAIDKIVDLSATEPLAALLKLSQTLEKELKVLAVSTAVLRSNQRSSPRQLIRLMASKNILPPHTVESLDQFRDVRNKIIHESVEISHSTIFKVLDIGLQLLKTLRQVPVEVITVNHPGIPIYKDEDCVEEYEEVKGIILYYTSPGTEMTKIWPVRKNVDFQKGDYVTKDWDCNYQWGQAWYIDPVTDKKKIAWTGVCEFVGVRVTGL